MNNVQVDFWINPTESGFQASGTTEIRKSVQTPPFFRNSQEKDTAVLALSGDEKA